MSIFSHLAGLGYRSRLAGRHVWAIAVVVGLLPLVAACGGVASTPESDASDTPSTASGKTAESTQQEGVAGSDAKQAKTSYAVPTITCPACSARVHASAMEEPGVIDTSIEGQDVTVTYDPQKTDPESIASAIREGGDTVERLDG